MPAAADRAKARVVDLDVLLKLLEDVRAGKTAPAGAARVLAELPFSSVGEDARVDHHRALRRGIPEAVFAPGKSPEQLVAIARDIVAHQGILLCTRLDDERAAALKAAIPDGTHEVRARAFWRLPGPWRDVGRGEVLVVCAGTSDLPVADEAAVALHAFGHRVARLADVGVAGIHRLLAERARLDSAEVVIVVAGMEGALASVVGGMSSRPVIAVPTSVGYGANLGGLSALLGMLTSCAGGVTVVNIDNGFGAACAAALINRRRESEP